MRLIVKLGTSVLTGGTGRLDRAHMVELVRQCARLHGAGHEVVVVSSGAIAAGRERMGRVGGESLATKQMLAAVGQSRLMRTWERLFDLYDVRVGQVLLTRADVRDRGRYLNARDAFEALLAHGIIPVVNENDAVATAEIKVGDNDNLSALVAGLVEAHLLLLLTDQPGLFTADPRLDPTAELIPEIRAIDASLARLAAGSTSGLGTGGMATKLHAADLARRGGTTVVIAAGRAPEVILRLVDGETLGTRFPATETPLEARKRWILGGAAPSGRIHVDAGAEAALRERGSSLLPAGITAIEGAFARGASVLIVGPTGVFARGITRYDHTDLERIRGLHSDAVAERLGYAYGPVVHRNDLITG